MASNSSAEDVIRAMLRLADRTNTVRRALAHRHHGTLGDRMLLRRLAAGGGTSVPRELGEYLGVSSGTLTAMLDRLEQEGLVRRAPHPSDRRSVLVELTEAGAASLSEVDDALTAAVRRAVPAAQRRALVASLQALEQAVDDL